MTEKETRPKVIDFSKVETTTVTVKVVDSEEKPVSAYDFTMRALVRDASGGHDHSEGRPTGRFVTEQHDTLTEVEGKTDTNGQAKYKYLCSGIGGIDSIYVKGQTPYDTATATIALKFGDFQLMTEGGHYDLVGAYGESGVNSQHRVNHYGTPHLIKQLKALADSLYADSSHVLRLNDMSIQFGGPFDIWNKWDTPHQTHRLGVNGDVSYLNAAGVIIDSTHFEARVNDLDGTVQKHGHYHVKFK